MFAPANHAQFEISFPSVEHDFKVFEFTGEEKLNEPFTFTVQLLSETPDLDLSAFLQQSVFLNFSATDGPKAAHGVHGLVYSIAQGASAGRLSRYTLVLKPKLAYLHHSHNHRIFQHQTVPDIISQVLDAHDIVREAHFFFELDLELYPEREYCVQYGESDLHFVQRLCEEEGLHFHFRHTPTGHALIFGDDNMAFALTDSPAVYGPGGGMVADTPTVQDFVVRLAVRTTDVGRRDYSFEKPHLTLGYEATLDDKAAPPSPPLEDYHYPGGFDGDKRGNFLAARALERHRSDSVIAEGESDQSRLRSGQLFELSEHTRDDWNSRWLLIGVKHHGKQPQALQELTVNAVQTQDGFNQGYRNHFVAIPEAVPYRPQLAHPKQKIFGSQTAKVTGPAGEEIHCDEKGRIKAQFYWDRTDRNTDKSSCWLRVASGWAGQNFGAVSLPRVGTEVLVTFQEGDPDRPLVTGSLYNATHPLPYDLPEHKTRSVLRSRSTPHVPGSNAFSELSIEDRTGHERIFIQAERDLEQLVKNDYRLNIGKLHELSIKGTSVTRIDGLKTLSVGGWQVQSDTDMQLKASTFLTLDGGVTLTLNAGGQHLVLCPAGIFSSVPIEQGGVPTPLALGRAYLPQLHAVVGAAQSVAPICAICEKLKALNA